MKFNFNVSAITHVLAVAFSAAVVFVMSPAGQALVKQYPKLSVASGILLAIAAVYHVPTSK